MASSGPFTEAIYDAFIQLQLDTSGQIMGITHSGVDTTPLTDPIDVANAVFDAFTSAWQDGLDTNLIIGPVLVRRGEGAGNPPTVGVSTDPLQAGGTSMSSLPSSCSVLIKKITATGGRIGRGRVYLPHSLGEGGVDEKGIVGSTQVADHQARAGAWLAALAANDVPMGLRHRTGPATDTIFGVTSLLVTNLIGTQRRRLGR